MRNIDLINRNMDIQHLQLTRKVFLLKLYETTGGDIWKNPIMYDIGKSIGIDNSLTDSISDYLDQKELIEINTKDRDISITASGIDEAEKFFENDNEILSNLDIKNKLDEINSKLDLLSLGHEIIYEDILKELGSSKKIQSKDLRLLLLSTAFTYGLDALKLGELMNILK